MLLTTALAGCGAGAPASDNQGSDQMPEATDESQTADHESNAQAGGADIPENHIELSLNVYYNDADHSYYANESGESIIVTKEGQYTVSFDCAKDLSEDAVSAGVDSLYNLTAIYLKDVNAGGEQQSPISACNIFYDSVVVDGTSLTVTQTAPKSALKGSGIFDTNDPINGWDGSSVEEVMANSDHVANFTTLDHPKTISVTFTLSDMAWDAAESTKKEEAVTASGYKNPSVFSNVDFTNIDALTLTKDYLGNGINLGNTMEAYGRATLGVKARVGSYETYWGQPITTPEMLQGMKDCGFDTVRIPVSWTNMIAYETGDYTIDPAYLDRVEEIVNYALDAEMFVIINDHWDGGWWAMFGSSDPTSAQNAFNLYESMWKQIAKRFENYSDMVIFESANEELGDGLNNNSHWPDSGSLSQDECYQLTNQINQFFVDTIRQSGGNNDDRFLLIAGYNTDFERTCDSRYKMPTDTADHKLLLSVHYYTPWNYCGAEKDARWGLKNELETMDRLFASLTKFTDEGYGVIIGEYAALPIYDSSTKTSSLKQNTAEFTNRLLDNCDLYNYCPMLWSCNDYFNKKTGTMITQEMLDLFTGRCLDKEMQAGDDYLTQVKANMDAAMQNAPEMYDDVVTYEPGTPVAWIMWNGGAGTYSVGDVYNPADNTMGIHATDVVVDGPGEYTVRLDFDGGNTGLTFAALALADGELLYPGCILKIKEICYDDQPVKLIAMPYTSSDDGKCTRVNLLNEWVGQAPSDARTAHGVLEGTSPVILDKTQINGIGSISITFELIVPEN